MTTVMHFLTLLVPFLALGVQLMMSPEVKPMWMTAKQPWPRIWGAGLSILGTTLSAHAAGDPWDAALMKGLMGLVTTGVIGHGLTPAAKPTNTNGTATVNGKKPEEKAA